MDLDDVVDLANNAAESVLRFHVVASKSKNPFVDIKAFKSSMQSAIRQSVKKNYRNDDHTELAALTDITSLSGDAAFRAATEWNSLSDPANHIHPEWFRNCVRGLVSGAVDNIAASANLVNEPRMANLDIHQFHEHLDPSADRLMVDSCRHIGSGKNEHLNYYGFGPAQPPRGPEDGQQSAIQEKDRNRPSNIIKSAWKAINQYAANPFSSNASAKCQATLANLAHQETNEYQNDEDEEMEDEEQHESDVAHDNTKGRRALTAKGVSHHNKMPSSGKASTDSALTPRSGNERKPSRNWTKQEQTTLVNARQEGKTWSAIHELLVHRTAAACEKKYRDLHVPSQNQETQSTTNTDTREQEREDPAATDTESGDEEMENDADTDNNAEGS